MIDIEKAKKIIEQVFTFLGTPAEEISYSLVDKKGHVFSVKSIELEKVSVEREDIVKDLVYIIKRLFEKNISTGEESFKYTIDINDLQSKADGKIKMKALKVAEEARNLKTDILMDPMTSYERMVVHSTLAGMPDISTESVGVDKERRLKVKYLAI